jgi:hypothetical protein
MTTALTESSQDSAVTMRLAKELAQSGFAVGFKGNPQDVLAVLLTGKELGIGPMAALRHISMISGKPTLSAQMQLALLRKAGHRITVAENTRTRAAIVGITPHGDTVESEYTIEEAEQAGLTKKSGAWSMYPKDMLWARCVTRYGRMADEGGTLAMYSPADFDERDVVEVKANEVAPPKGNVLAVQPADPAGPEDDVLAGQPGDASGSTGRLDSPGRVPEGEVTHVDESDLREIPLTEGDVRELQEGDHTPAGPAAAVGDPGAEGHGQGAGGGVDSLPSVPLDLYITEIRRLMALVPSEGIKTVFFSQHDRRQFVAFATDKKTGVSRWTLKLGKLADAGEVVQAEIIAALTRELGA